MISGGHPPIILNWGGNISLPSGAARGGEKVKISPLSPILGPIFDLSLQALQPFADNIQ